MINQILKKETLATLKDAKDFLHEGDEPDPTVRAEMASAVALIEIARSLQRLEEVLTVLPAQF
jgi:hypothetical protein